MGKKDQTIQKEKERVESVLSLLRKQAPLTLKQEKFCNYACIERFLKSRGDNVKRAAKQLRACLSWRESIGIDHLIADEFSAELAEGVAYVAGHDDESRPVTTKIFGPIVIFPADFPDQARLPEVPFTETVYSIADVHAGGCNSNHAQKGFYRSASAFMNMLLAILKIIAEYYPGRLHKAFVIDPPSLFSYLWKGVRPFVELSPLTTVVSSLDFEDSLDFSHFPSYPRASSLRFDPSSLPPTAKIGSCTSSRFSFTVSHSFDSVKPWHLTLTDTSSSKVGPTNPSPSLLGPALISPLNARSLSFASPVDRAPRGKGFYPSTPLPQKTQMVDPASIHHPRTPKPSFLQSPATFFRKECHVGRSERSRDSFVPFLKFYRRPYDEMTYRSKMKPPLGGLISIVSPQLRRRHMSVSQRF
ncbi:Sec14p-like phosphatidylinositol transfer family protein [Actinidia rufa]|uniref:Sec14p-like phosphatidylinositol transfer family protein n=1 Tax=Actinidia rufa TaxID=165716 RepID=A0A7J0GTD4_9ERIC|nr:Sec14p-like phosphatidylinositol transfer family protein [Actinidia rufa]